MTTPPRMMVLTGGGYEALCALPPTYDKAVLLAVEKFAVPTTHLVRLSCKASDMAWIGGMVGNDDLFIADNDSFHYACAGKHVVRFNVHVYDKNPPKPAPPPAPAASAPAPAPAQPAKAADAKAPVPAAAAPAKTEGVFRGWWKGLSAKPAPVLAAPALGPTADVTVSITKADGKSVELKGSVIGDLAKSAPPGRRSPLESRGQSVDGPTGDQDKTLKETFTGRQLGPGEIVTKCKFSLVATPAEPARHRPRQKHCAPALPPAFRATASRYLVPRGEIGECRLLVASAWAQESAARGLALRGRLDGLCCVSFDLALPRCGTTALEMVLEGQAWGHRRRHVDRDREQGSICGNDVSFARPAPFAVMDTKRCWARPSPKPRPEGAPGPSDPLIPAWPDVRPQNAWCLPQTIFVPHIDRILTSLGLPVESRTSMITSWLPSITRHKHIAYRILNTNQLNPSSVLTIIPPPQVLLRIFILFKGIAENELKEWEQAGILHAEMGLDWRDAVGYSGDMSNESLFRVVEYGAM
ncbi:hypothetical protein P7C73_g3965, partial [Tremellales sp. Uapishka_1]